jgi:hypothetical protein
MRRRVSRIFAAPNRPRLGLSDREVAVRLRPLASGIALGATGLNPSVRRETPDLESGASTTTTTVRRSQ